MTSALEHAVFSAARTAGLFRLLRARHRRELLVLTYHSVVEADASARERHPLVYRNAVSAEHFEAQMRHLRRHYHPLDGDDLRAVLDGAPLPEHAVLVTFDDGLLNNATVALPRLRTLDVPAVFFLPTGFLDAAADGDRRLHWTEALVARLSSGDAEEAALWGDVAARLPELDTDLGALSPARATLHVVDHLKSLSRAVRTDRLAVLQDLLPALDATDFPADAAGHSVLGTMTWDHARQAADHGVSLGSHTVNHAILNRLPNDEAEAEITDSRDRIRAATGQPADLFAYPNGGARDFGPVHQDMLARAGYRGAFTQIAGFNDASTDPLRLRRIDVSGDYHLPTFCYFASGCKAAADRLRGRR